MIDIDKYHHDNYKKVHTLTRYVALLQAIAVG